MRRGRPVLIWALLGVVLAVPIGAAAVSPLLQWRGPVHVAGGFAGILALALMLVQPLLAAGDLPGLGGLRGRRVHRWVGSAVVLLVAAHVVGLWIASPPDIVDALTFTAPTPFSAWGVVAMWALFAAAFWAAARRRFRGRLRLWRRGHTALVIVVVAGSAVHALLIEGAMETVSKTALCLLAAAALAQAVVRLRA